MSIKCPKHSKLYVYFFNIHRSANNFILNEAEIDFLEYLYYINNQNCFTVEKKNSGKQYSNK